MSNSNPSVKELLDVVEDINCKWWESGGADVFGVLLELQSDGYTHILKCLGTAIWDSENDVRSYLEDDEGICILVNGEEQVEDLRIYIRNEIGSIINYLQITLFVK